MNNTKLIAAVVLAGVAYATYNHIHANIIVKMYPDFDPKIVRKAHRIMIRRGLAGAYEGMDDSNETMDRIFRAVVKELRSK